MTERVYRIGTRRSPLALKQVEEALGFLRKERPFIKTKIVGIDTRGDKERDTPISEIEGSDFFTKEIDEALLKGRVDFAIHSAKDLPDNLAKGLAVAAITESIDPYDALVSKDNLKLDELKCGAKIGTSSLRRKQQLKKYRNDFNILDIRGNIGERLRMVDEGGLDAIVIAAAGLIRLGLEKRIAQRIPFEIIKPHPLQGSLAIVAREDSELITPHPNPLPLQGRGNLDIPSPRAKRGERVRVRGKVYLVGAGPGRSDLITVRGLNILKEADVIIYDYLVNKSLLEHAKESAKLICCDKLGGKRHSDGFLVHQERINNLLIAEAKDGKRVVRLKNGDPSIFGRSTQELEALVKNRIEYEVVPGVTAAQAASASCGIPLTDRRYASSCVFVTGHEDPAKNKSWLDWNALARAGTVVLYMAVENLNAIASKLIKAGKDKNTPVALIQDASLITQRLLTGRLKDIAKGAKRRRIKPPAIAIIGEVAGLEKRFNWLRKNKRVLFTGLSQERFFIKGVYFHLPLIKIEPMDSYREFDNHLRDIRTFDWIVFASRYGAEYFFKRLKKLGCDSRMLSGIKIAAIGNSTNNRLSDFGISADLVPEKESSEGLIDEFKKMRLRNKNIYLPRSDISDKNLKRSLETLGARVTTGFAYKNRMPDDLPDLDLASFDEIIFTSPSCVRNFKRRYKKAPKDVKIKCIGDVTLKEAKRWNLAG